MPNATQVVPPATFWTPRKRWLAIVGSAFLAIAMAYGAYWMLALRYWQSTDDAYVSGNVVQSTAFINHLVDQQAAMLSANDIFWASAVLFLLLIGVVWLARPEKRAAPAEAAAGAH